MNELRGASSTAGVLALTLACATVTQTDPPSQLDQGIGNATPGGGGRGAAGRSTDDGIGAQASPGGASDPPSPGGPDETETPSSGGATPAEAPPENDAPPESSNDSDDLASPDDAAAPPPRFPSGTLLLSEDFENFDASSWVTTEGSSWAIQNDDETGSSVFAQSSTDGNQAHLAVSGDVSWTDVVVEASFKVIEFEGSSSSYMAGLCVRVSDAENFYLVGLRSNDGEIGLRRFADSNNNLVQSSFDQGAIGVWYRLRVEAIGTTISAYLDDELMLSFQDSAHPSGGIALCTVRGSAVFDDVVVTAP